MELQFPKNAFGYLRRAAWEIKNEEQTQEIRLADSFPDIGKIVGAWGQPLVRSKEWMGSSMRISGGVMAWVLYVPEEGEALRCVETWIPFQIHWDFPQTQHDGTMRVMCLMKGIDARSVSARKIMVRSLISTVGEALEPVNTEIYCPDTVPDDIQLLKKSFPVQLPVEAGETVITLDEELTPNSSDGQIHRIIYCSVEPEITDQKVLADKVVYRGNALIHFLCEYENEQICSFDFDVPFSQYAQLEQEYRSDTSADVMPAITNLETEIQENGKLRLKLGIAGQYVIYDKPVLEVVTDAYSTKRPVVLRQQELALPAVLDMGHEILKVEVSMDDDIQMLDAAMVLSHPIQHRGPGKVEMEIPGSFQIFGYGNDHSAIGNSIRWERKSEIPMYDGTALFARSSSRGKKMILSTTVNGELAVDTLLTGLTDIPMVTGMELGEQTEAKSDRPSLILRRVGNSSLWDIAKAYCTTVETIREANGITDEPSDDQVLLIPVS